jgi:hypothetical protein
MYWCSMDQRLMWPRARTGLKSSFVGQGLRQSPITVALHVPIPHGCSGSSTTSQMGPFAGIW